ncbi:MAG: hypothetical protein AB7G06_02495 [Bdellovibrionales bacterium]
MSALNSQPLLQPAANTFTALPSSVETRVVMTKTIRRRRRFHATTTSWLLVGLVLAVIALLMAAPVGSRSPLLDKTYPIPVDVMFPAAKRAIFIGGTIDCTAENTGLLRYRRDGHLDLCNHGSWHTLVPTAR